MRKKIKEIFRIKKRNRLALSGSRVQSLQIKKLGGENGECAILVQLRTTNKPIKVNPASQTRVNHGRRC